MEVIIFALISYFSWGTGALIEAIVARKINPYSFTFWSFVLSVFILSFYAFFQTTILNLLTLNVLIINIVLGIVLIVGIIAYLEAYRNTSRVIVGTIAQSFPSITVMLSVIFLGERVYIAQAVAIIIIFVGMFLSMFDFSEFKKRSFTINKGFLLAVLAMICWGTYFTFIKIPVEKIGWFWPNYIVFLLFPLIFIYMRIIGVKLENPKKMKKSLLTLLIISTILPRIAEFSYNLGISKGLVTIVASIAGANVTFFSLLAFFILKDPIKRQQIFGIIVTLIGIILLSVFSVSK